MGLLTAYLLASDISYTNVVPKATPLEVGQIIHIIGKESFREMMVLRLIDNEGDEEDTALAYAKLYQYLCDKLTEPVKRAIGFDVYSLDYCLCKRFQLAYVL